MISDPKTAKWLIDSFHVLELIESMTDKDMETKPSDVALQVYLDKLKDIQDEPKRKKFLATKQSRVSRMISRLKDLGLIKTIKYGEEMDGRYKFYQVTEKGRQLLDYPDVKNKLKEIAKKSSDKAKIDPEDYLKTIEREKHSDDIRTLLKRIKTELDQAFIKEVFPDELNYPFILKRLDEFPFEKDILYEDLAHHLGTFMDFSEFKRLLEEFKKKGKEYIGIESRLE
ncbi:MAG: MarR family transcriptional regulator [Candidatus Thermoplasmatota archaeon]|jgi:DNA-binding MarR family transcriptional regulator|nr:MarR family transcriptional regulator [Candidatus Thermoplasmatota archaeon]